MRKIIIIISIVLIVFYFAYSFLLYKKPSDENTITFASWGSQSEVSILNELIEEFVSTNKVNVDFLHIPQNYFQKLHLLYSSNNEPDVIFINNQNIQLYIEAGLLEDLSPYFLEENDMFNNEALNCFKKDNKLYAIPRDISNLVLYYNKDIFKNKNINIPQKIKNQKQLKEIILQVKDNNTWGINCEDNPLYWMFFLSSNGGGVISDDKKEIIINKEESIEALNLYKDYVHKYKIAPSLSEIGSMTTAQMFINGKLAMYLGGRWMFPIFSETITFDWDTITFPTTENNKLYIDSSGWAISKKSSKKDKAIKLIKFLSSKESSMKFVKSGLVVPARKDSTELFLNENKKNKAFIKMLENAKPTPTNKNYNKINDILKEKSKLMLEVNAPIEETFDEKTIKKLESFLW